jgi:hypothetical protein
VRRRPSIGRVLVAMVRVDLHNNPFRVDRIWRRRPVSLSISAWPAVDGLSVIDTAGARTVDLLDALRPAGHPSVAVLNVTHNAWLDDENSNPLPMRDVARNLAVPAVVADVGWTTPDAGFGNDLLIVTWPDLDRLLRALEPGQADLLDVPTATVDPDLLALVVNGLGPAENVLPTLPGSTFYCTGDDLLGHFIETTDAALPGRLFARLLAMFAGAALLGTAAAVDVPELDPATATDLLGRAVQWIATVARCTPGSTVTIGLSSGTGRWQAGDPLPPDPELLLTFDAQSGTWGSPHPGR